MNLLDFWLKMTGTVLDFAGLTPPPGWLFADGRAVSRTTYPDLFKALVGTFTANVTAATNVITAVSPSPSSMGMVVGMTIMVPGLAGPTTIGNISGTTVTLNATPTTTQAGAACEFSAYGLGNGSSTFNVPDLRGRVAAGRDNMGGTAAARLSTAGAGINGLLVGAAGGDQTHILTVAQMPAHTHTYDRYSGTGGSGGTPVTGTGAVAVMGSATSGSGPGTGAAHNNTQPTIVMNKIIKT